MSLNSTTSAQQIPLQNVETCLLSLLTPHNLLIGTAGIFVLIALRFYFIGGRCRIKKDLTGKIAVITGGNTGIGKQTALQLARFNCNIVIGARDKGKNQQAVKEIKEVNPKINVSYCYLDLGDKVSIQEFAEYVNENCSQIDYLVNNAGVMAVPDKRLTKDGLEMQMGINHFGHFYLTYLLFDKLKKAERFRVVNLSSLAHRFSFSFDTTDLNSEKSYSEWDVYGKSKLANIYFARTLQKKFDQAKLNGIAVSVHPGFVRTELFRYFKWYMQIITSISKPIYSYFSKNAQQGAQTSLFALLADENQLQKGEYYADCSVASSSRLSKDMEIAQKLWTASEATWNIKFDI